MSRAHHTGRQAMYVSENNEKSHSKIFQNVHNVPRVIDDQERHV